MKHIVKELKCHICNCNGKGCKECDGKGYIVDKIIVTVTEKQPEEEKKDGN